MTDPCEQLANAVILLAVKDWRGAVKTLKKSPRCTDAKRKKDECESFFLSGWFGELTAMNGEWLLEKLKKEAGIDDE